MLSRTPAPVDPKWLARQVLFSLGELRPRDLTTDEILQLNSSVVATISNRTMAALWRTLQQRRCSFAQLIKFFDHTDYCRAPRSVWTTIIEHRQCSFTRLYELHRKTKDYQVVQGIKKVIARRTDWKPADLWRKLQRLDRNHYDPEATRDIAEAIIFRPDCPTDV